MFTSISSVTFRTLLFIGLGSIFFGPKELIATRFNNEGANIIKVNSNSPTSKFPNDNGYFVLYYGDGQTEEQLKKHFERIRETKPAFVVVGYFGKNASGPVDLKQAKQVLCVLRGGSAKECVKNPFSEVNKTAIKTIYYVTADGKDSIINSQIESVMSLGYDGIFFDETDHQTEEVQNNRYKDFATAVHKFDTATDKKTVIVNPGVSDANVCRMFEYADIVSVENHWDKAVPGCNGIDKSRWLAIQGDPSKEPGDYAQPPKNTEVDKAVMRLNCFRKNGGLWYFTTGWNGDKPVHWRLPDFLETFAAEAKQETAKCGQ